jgi:hypothetical protein
MRRRLTFQSELLLSVVACSRLLAPTLRCATGGDLVVASHFVTQVMFGYGSSPCLTTFADEVGRKVENAHRRRRSIVAVRKENACCSSTKPIQLCLPAPFLYVVGKYVYLQSNTFYWRSFGFENDCGERDYEMRYG